MELLNQMDGFDSLGQVLLDILIKTEYKKIENFYFVGENDYGN